MKTAIFYGSTTGTTEMVAGKVGELFINLLPYILS